MKTFTVTRKATGVQVFRYDSETAIEWNGMEWATHDHTEVAFVPAAPAPTGPRRLTKLQFTDRMGDAAYAAILSMARASSGVEIFVDRFRNATPEQDGTAVDLDDPRTVAGITAIGAALVAAGVVSEGWAREMMNG